jgi:carboxyl-terminal processing protease
MENQIETNNKPNYLKLGAVVVVLCALIFGAGFVTGQGRVKISGGKIEITKGNVPTGKADYSLLWDALDLVNQKYVDRPLDQEKLLYGAVQGLVAGTGDPYTAFFDPDDAKAFREQLAGSFSGIGAQLGSKDGQLVIIAPLEDTPAQKAGLLAGDIILAINEESTEGMSVDVAVSKIRGPAGTNVKLTIIHKDKHEPIEITIKRAKIVVKSVKLETKEVDGKRIAVIKISEFGDDTKGLLDEAVASVVSGNYSGIILDLRNDPGGYLETAVSTIANWIDSGKVALKEIGYAKIEKEYKTEGLPRLKGYKTIVLVNSGSASASEIVAGALQDYGVATLVGEKTFGKGSVQELQDLSNGTQIKITIAKWFTPKGRGIDKKGLEPDVKVDLTADDANAERDPQMDKALELLK